MESEPTQRRLQIDDLMEGERFTLTYRQAGGQHIVTGIVRGPLRIEFSKLMVVFEVPGEGIARRIEVQRIRNIEKAE